MEYDNKEPLPLAKIIADFRARHAGSALSFGASSIMLFKEGFLFTLAKKKNWRTDDSGRTNIDFAGFGGKLEAGESPFDCLAREILEEGGFKVSEIRWARPSQTLLITGIDGKFSQAPILVGGDGNLDPFAVLDLKVDNKYGAGASSGDSFLLLFLYLGILEDGRLMEESPEADLPGYFYARGDLLQPGFEGVCLDNSYEGEDFSVFLKDRFKPEVSAAAVFAPKFTPQAIINSGLRYDDFIKNFK